MFLSKNSLLDEAIFGGVAETAALEVELVVVEGIAELDEGGVRVVVGIALREELTDVAQGPYAISSR